jgi:hypothetical protein
MARRSGILRRPFFLLVGLVLAMTTVTGPALASGGTTTPPPDFALGVAASYIVPGGFPTCPDYYNCNPDRNWEPRELTVGFFGITGYQGATLVLQSLNGFSGTVTLELLNLPPGVTSQTATTMTVAANATTSTPFKLQASATTPTGDYTVTVRVTGGSLVHEWSAPLHVVDPLPALPPEVQAPFSVVGGGQYQATVSLGFAAPAGGLVVNLSSDDPVASVPASVAIPAGASSVSFTITTSPVTAKTAASIRAAISPNGWAGSDFMFVEPSATIDQAQLFPRSVLGGDPSAVTVNLSAAVAEPAVVNLQSTADPAVAPLPASFTIPAGSSDGFVPIPTRTVTADTVVAVSSTFNGPAKLVYLGVTAASSPPPGGVVSLKQAQYDSAKKTLQVEVNSSDAVASEVAAVFVGSTVQKIGTLPNAGGGTFKGTLAWPVNPQTIAIASSRGWAFPDVSVTAR